MDYDHDNHKADDLPTETTVVVTMVLLFLCAVANGLLAFTLWMGGK